ncbi:hypothetical protein [Myxococcus landrumensis]|uniref:Uncharacterized protein n=1 Tax=Myxococcus landrumensis TaxID=2813577 RepID=A0ABX7N181_9BACT|nr:hypothetical protein [Myxococcus landrumus]QSQ12348.1 hypothetical protein JY572_28845 [Myxococcus landrumus]
MRDMDELAPRLKWGLLGLGLALVLLVLVSVLEWRPLSSKTEAMAPEAEVVAPGAQAAQATKTPRAKVVSPVEALPAATVVALEPGDVVPEPEVENAPPQQNDEIQPELPQTARWRLEKTTHITTLLGRDVERLERERAQADARGDAGRVRQLDTMLQRNRGRLVILREEIRTLTDAAEQESRNER